MIKNTFFAYGVNFTVTMTKSHKRLSGKGLVKPMHEGLETDNMKSFCHSLVFLSATVKDLNTPQGVVGLKSIYS